ncbi:MAG TPA: MTH938/NDUFAF3 family protein [Caulobacteraceae bacterium]|nr:MTH938/NDUFAF3 family protein [Caulobacteraceae bacterium]
MAALRTPPSIDAFGPGGFRVDGTWRPGSLLILQDAPRDWRPRGLAEVTVDDIQAVLAAPRGAVEFLLLGVGPRPGPPPRVVREALQARRLGLEFMTTEAAARLHNVLASQGRLFATALIAL